MEFLSPTGSHAIADSIGGFTNAYDAENRLTTSTLNSIPTTYAYDGEGHRVQKTTSGVTRTYVYNVGGDLVAEYTNSTAASNLNCAVCYPATDNLGSTRLITAGGTGQVIKRMDFLPFGEIIPATVDGRTTALGYESTEDPTAPTMRFTGKELDSETYLDYFGARYFSGAQGRFTSPDPIGVVKQKFIDPQQWNMFSYARNNPLRFVDPTGKIVFLPQDAGDRERILGALKAGVGEKAAAYLGVSQTNGIYYIKVQDTRAFAAVNAVSDKLSGIIADQNRIATVRFESPGTKVGNVMVGSADRGMTPGVTAALPNLANVHITAGGLGALPANLAADGQRRTMTLAEVLIHELGHVDATWYHSASESNGDAVRIENQVRQIEQVPNRLGHDQPYDVMLQSVLGY